jgi:AcrR family transcriptional regulator
MLDAALDLFIADGYEGMTMEGVAARAGVAKTTVYRRWPSKADLVVDAILALVADIATPDTGSVRDDLVALLTQLQRLMTETRAGDVFPRMAAEVAVGSAMGLTYLERVIRPRTDTVRAVLTGGIERGELSAGSDVDLVVDMVVGPVILAKLTRRLSPRGSKARAERIVDTLLGGLGAHPSAPPTERGPS